MRDEENSGGRPYRQWIRHCGGNRGGLGVYEEKDAKFIPVIVRSGERLPRASLHY